MGETLLRVLAVGSLPLFAVVFFVGVGALDRRTSLFRYRDEHSQFVYTVFLSGFAVVFLAVAGLDPSLGFAPWLPAVALLGGVMYHADTAIWVAWTGEEVRETDRSVRWLLPALVAPIPEEVLFREGLAVVGETLGSAGFVAVSAVLFGVAHAPRGKKEVAFKTFNGAMYASVYVASGNLLVPIVAHVGYNVAYVWYVSSLPSASELTARED